MNAQLHKASRARSHGLAVAAAALAVAAGLNTASVAVQKRFGLLTRIFGRAGWYVHLALIITAWAGFLLSLVGLDRRTGRPLPPRFRPVGIALLAAAAALWLAAFARLGAARTANGSFFGRGSSRPVRDGVYRFRDNPMYDSYVLALVGLALTRASAAYLVLAAEGVVLLHGLEARVENRPFRPDRSARRTVER